MLLVVLLMTLLLAVVGLPAGLAAATKGDQPCLCPAGPEQSDKVVCGSDGITYPSLCELQCSRKRTESTDGPVFLGYIGPCSEAAKAPSTEMNAQIDYKELLTGASRTATVCCELCRQKCVVENGGYPCSLTSCQETMEGCSCQCSCQRPPVSDCCTDCREKCKNCSTVHCSNVNGLCTCQCAGCVEPKPSTPKPSTPKPNPSGSPLNTAPSVFVAILTSFVIMINRGMLL